MGIGLTDLYSLQELNDEEETLFHELPEDFETLTFEVSTLPHHEINDALTPAGDMSVLDAFDDFADADQDALVRGKMEDFDSDRVVIFRGKRLLDGHHHVVAAHLKGEPVRFIDLDAPVPDSVPTPP